jgi:exopolysaccharide biosynthesis predicted pyruvyltransferase EpsI
MELDFSKIKITKEALHYLNEKRKLAVTIGYPDYRTNGDFAVVPVPEIFAKKPKSENEYHKINIEGIDVYISKLVYLPENDVVIDVDCFLKIHFLTIAGFSTKD